MKNKGMVDAMVLLPALVRFIDMSPKKQPESLEDFDSTSLAPSK